MSESGKCRMRFDGDHESEFWPIMARQRVVGYVDNVERGYRARREAGGVTHVGPDRPFHDQALMDFQRWLDNPLSNLRVWMEVI